MMRSASASARPWTKLTTSTRGRIDRIRSWLATSHGSELTALSAFGQIRSRSGVDVDPVPDAQPVVDRARVRDRHAQTAVARGEGRDGRVAVDRVPADEVARVHHALGVRAGNLR